MQWTRQHPRLAWLALVALVAIPALFMTDIGMNGSASISGTKIALAVAALVAITALLLATARRGRIPPSTLAERHR